MKFITFYLAIIAVVVAFLIGKFVVPNQPSTNDSVDYVECIAEQYNGRTPYEVYDATGTFPDCVPNYGK